MRVTFFALITNYYFLSFFVLCLGMLFGESRRMGKLRFGVSGPFFVGIVTGWGVYSLALTVPPNDPAYEVVRTMMKNNVVPANLEAFMLTLFVAAVGLIASRDLRFVLKKYGAKFLVLGALITAFGAVTAYVGCVKLLPGGNAYRASGLYTGALTSSPGLGAALESSAGDAVTEAGRYEGMTRGEQAELLLRIDPSGRLTPEDAPRLTEEHIDALAVNTSAEVGMAYAIAYPFGLISVILGMMFLPRLFRIDCASELALHRSELNALRAGGGAEKIESVEFDFKSYALVCAAGYIVGLPEVRMGGLGVFRLGATGGVFISSVAFGYIGKLGPFIFRMSGNTINTFKDISLGTYLGMVGLTYGYSVVNSLAGPGILYAAASLVIGMLCVLVGFLVGRYAFGLNWVLLSGAICGGMTANPGLGVVSSIMGSDEPAAGYAAAYPTAITGMVFCTLLMYAA